MKDILELNRFVEAVEPHLEAAMKHHPVPVAEGFELSTPKCGFASGVLQAYLLDQQLRRADLMIGKPFDDTSKVPKDMRNHVVVQTPGATLDATWTQFFSLVGLDPKVAAEHYEVAALYPPRRVALIPEGREREFGERYADYALDVASRLPSIYQDILPGEVASNGILAKHSEDTVHDMMSDMWNPDRYEPYDSQGDAGILIQAAVADIARSKNKPPRQ